MRAAQRNQNDPDKEIKMPRIPAFVRFLAVCAALCVLAAACGSSDTATDPDNSTAEPVPDATATVPTSPTVEANETPEPAPTTQSSLVAVAEEATSAAGLTGPFYEFTLVDYVDGATPDDYDHESFLVHGAELVYAAEVETQLQGDTEWDRVEVVFYPDTATYLGTLASDDYAERGARPCADHGRYPCGPGRTHCADYWRAAHRWSRARARTAVAAIGGP